MATIVSGSPLARRRAVCGKARSSRASCAGAVHAIVDDAADGVTAFAALLPGAGGMAGAVRVGARAAPIAAVGAGVAAGAAAVISKGATIRAGDDTCACAAAIALAKITTQAAPVRDPVLIRLFWDISALFVFFRHPGALH